MKTMRSLFFISILLLSFQACAQPECLLLGKGGGISGKVEQFKISSRGKIYKGTGITDIEYSQTGKIKRREARKLFDEIKSISDSSFHHPGNVYYFIKIIDDDCTTEYTWGEKGFEVPEIIGIFYKKTKNSLSDITYKPVKKHVK